MFSIKNIIRRIFDFYFYIPIKLASKINKKLTAELMVSVCENYEKVEPSFTTLLCRPKYDNQLHILDNENNNILNKIAIVLQGLPDYKDDFTLNSIKIYRKMFPCSKIILSTWDTVSDAYLKKAKELGCQVVLSKLPEVTGVGNINYQVKSSLEGIIEAKKMGCEFVLKTRTDQRIYRYNLCEFLYSLLLQFPSNNKNQHKRIIVLQGSTGCMFIPYYIADFFYFGYIKDMELLFSLEENKLDFLTRKEYDDYTRKLCQKYSIGEVFKRIAPQNIIIESYCKTIGTYSTETVEGYWGFVKDCLIGINVDQLGLYWKKYSSNIFENSWSHDYEFGDSDQELLSYNWTFSNWLNLYTGVMQYRTEFEKFKERKRVM